MQLSRMKEVYSSFVVVVARTLKVYFILVHQLRLLGQISTFEGISSS